MTSGQADWRPVIAALANPHTRRIFAQIVLGAPARDVGEGLSTSKRDHALGSLVGAGLITDVDGDLVEVPEVFARLLAVASPGRQDGVERYLDGHGEIDRYPTRAADRRALLELVAHRTLAATETLTERELNERLVAFGPDTALLRRYLVDEGVLRRSADGAAYSWSGDVTTAGTSPEP